MKKLNVQTAYQFNVETGRFLVTLERITNDRNGNPRYRAVIVNLGDASDGTNTTAYAYSGQGSYAGEKETASRFLEHHLQTVYGWTY